METIVEVKSLTKQFGDFVALSRCTLDVAKGQVLGLLGPNGAGKSTLIRLLLGFLKPSQGTATICGLDCYRQRAAVHQQLSYLPGDARLSSLMRGHGVLKFFASLRPDASLERATVIAERLELDLDRWVGLMSTGMRQKLAIALTVAVDSPLLILDEPTANLDPSVRGEVLNLVREAKQNGKTVIFSSHVLSEIEDVCDEVCILRAGKLVHQQALDLSRNTHVIEATLEGGLPDIPSELRAANSIIVEAGNLRIESVGDLAPMLGWLANLPVCNVSIRQTALQDIYNRFHGSGLRKAVDHNTSQAK